LGVVALIALWAIAVYNGLVGGRNQAQTAWSQIDVQLKRRHDLIPNLVQVAALTQATRGLFALVESYPQLKANDNVKQLQEELTTTENKIAFARQFYNDSVNAYNNRRQSFPAVLAAASLGFGPIELFNMPDTEREVPKVALR
jgi:LemA protein